MLIMAISYNECFTCSFHAPEQAINYNTDQITDLVCDVKHVKPSEIDEVLFIRNEKVVKSVKLNVKSISNTSIRVRETERPPEAPKRSRNLVEICRKTF